MARPLRVEAALHRGNGRRRQGEHGLRSGRPGAGG